MTRDENVREAQRLRGLGLSNGEIGDRMGATAKAVSAWLCDPDLSKQRARRASYSKPCAECGSPTDGSAGRKSGPTLCAGCASQRRHDERYWTPERIIDAIHAWAAAYGAPPRSTDWNPAAARWHRLKSADLKTERFRAGRWPPTSTVQREFGTWRAALAAASRTPEQVAA